MKFLASSKPNIIRLYNDQYQNRPYIVVYANDAFESGTSTTLTIKGSGNDDDFELILTGEMDGEVTSTSFNTTNNTANNAILSLAEALKKNISIFYDVSTYYEDGKWCVKAYYDSSANYITTAGVGLSVIGDWMGKYIPIVKYIMHYKVNDGESEFDAEKHTNDKSITFNISNPFSNTIGKYPIKFNINGYKSFLTNTNTTLTTSFGDFNDTYIVLPTTCGEFYDIDYSDYFIDYNTQNKGKFLTNRLTREIGYDETVGMSLINNNAEDLKLKVMYFSPSGKFISEKDENALKSIGYYYSETVNSRTDIYLNPAIGVVETESGKQVGYCEVVVMNGSNEVCDRIKLTINGRCQSMNTVYFINKIGGVDWYSFSGSYENEISIDDNETYTSNYIGEYTNHTKHKTNVRYKTMEKTKTLNSGKISHSEALWLEELASSKYCFVLNEDDKYFYEIVVDDVDIDIDSSEKYAEASITYYMGDKDILK